VETLKDSNIPASHVVQDGQSLGREAYRPRSIRPGHILLDRDPVLDTDAVRKAYLDTAISNAVTQNVPQGLVSYWPNSRESIPAGYGLCDGQWYNPSDPTVGQVGQASSDSTHTIQTPNILDRFLAGAGSTYAVGDTGDGSIPSHLHPSPVHAHGPGNLGTDSPGDHTHTMNIWAGPTASHGHATTGNPAAHPSNESTSHVYTPVSDGAHSHTVDSGTTDNSAAADTGSTGTGTTVIAKYFAAYPIMKLTDDYTFAIGNHHTRHENGGDDEITIEGLDGNSAQLVAHRLSGDHDGRYITLVEALNTFLNNPLAADLDANSKRIYNLPTPAADTDAATKYYVDNATPDLSGTYLKLDGSNDPMTGDLDIGTDNIINFPSASMTTTPRVSLEAGYRDEMYWA